MAMMTWFVWIKNRDQGAYLTRLGIIPLWPQNKGSGLYGLVAQLGAHLLCKQGVEGSNPFRSTLYMTFLISSCTNLVDGSVSVIL